MEALAAMALPHVLQTTYSALSIAWTQYEAVKEQKAQCTALLERCTELLLAVARRCGIQPNDLTLDHVYSLENACLVVRRTIQTLASHGFAWRMLHQSDIRIAILSAENALQTACTKFNINAHLSTHMLLTKMTEARERDQADLVAFIDRLSRSDESVLHALQGENQQTYSLNELVVAFTKYCRKASNPSNKIDGFIQAATRSLQRRSKTSSTDEIPSWSLTSFEVSFDRDQGARLGKGSFGCVYKGDWNGQVVAVKEMYVQDAGLLDDKSLKLIRREIKIWSQLAHPHILPFYGACLEASQPFIASKLCANGNVIGYLSNFPQSNRIRLLHETALGMTYLHGKGVIHADLKGVNILIADDGKALICDFGLAKLEDNLSTMGKKASTRSMEGSTRWMAPERWDENTLDFPSDVYSFGVTAWEFYSGEIPFHDVQDRFLHRRVVDKQERPSRPEPLTSDPLWKLVERCWQPDPNARPTFMIVRDDIKRLMDSSCVSDEVLEREDVKRLKAICERGVHHLSRRRFGDAEVLLKQVRADSEKSLGSEHELTLGTMHCLACVYEGQKRYGDAEALFKRTLAGREKILGTEHEDTLATMHWLAFVYERQERYGDAEALFKQTIAGREKILGTENESTLWTMYWLACVYEVQKRYGDAEALFKRTLAGQEKILGTEHEDTLWTMYCLARVYEGQKRYGDAEALFKRTLAGEEKILGTEHKSTFCTMQYLARVYERQERYGDAEALFNRTLAGREKILGTDHESTLETMHWLACVYEGQKRYGDAEALLKRTLAGRGKILGTDHESTLETMQWLASVYESQKRYRDAEALFKQTLVGREKILGTEHEDTLATMYWLARVYEGQKRYGDAEVLFKRTLAGLEKILGTDHKDTLTTMYWLACVYEGQMRYGDAEALFKRTLAGEEKVFGAEHEDTLCTKHALEGVYTKQGQSRMANLALSK